MLLSCSSNMLVITCKHDKYFTSLCVCVHTAVSLCVCRQVKKCNHIVLYALQMLVLIFFSLSFTPHYCCVSENRVLQAVQRNYPRCVSQRADLALHLYPWIPYFFFFFIFWESFCVCFSLSSQRWWFSMPHYFWLPECRNLHRPFKFLCLLLPRVCDLAKHSEDVAAFHNITENPTYTMLYLVLHNFSYFYFHRNITFWNFIHF